MEKALGTAAPRGRVDEGDGDRGGTRTRWGRRGTAAPRWRDGEGRRGPRLHDWEGVGVGVRGSAIPAAAREVRGTAAARGRDGEGKGPRLRDGAMGKGEGVRGSTIGKASASGSVAQQSRRRREATISKATGTAAPRWGRRRGGSRFILICVPCLLHRSISAVLHTPIRRYEEGEHIGDRVRDIYGRTPISALRSADYEYNIPERKSIYVVNDPYVFDCVSKLTRTEEDSLEKIESSPAETIMLQIEDIQITKQQLECLLNDSTLPAEVLEAWIRTFNYDKYDLHREDGKVMVETTYGIQQLLTVGLGEAELRNFGSSYLQHDMLFLPMRQEDHWHLVVVNAARQEIQMIDPAAKSNIRESEINKLFIVIEQCLEHGAKDGQSTNWQDHKITTWKKVPIKNIPKQKDRSSSTLFLMKFIQHWTGKKMTKRITQTEIDMFRLKIGPNLIMHPLNRAGKEDHTEEGAVNNLDVHD